MYIELGGKIELSLQLKIKYVDCDADLLNASYSYLNALMLATNLQMWDNRKWMGLLLYKQV